MLCKNSINDSTAQSSCIKCDVKKKLLSSSWYLLKINMGNQEFYRTDSRINHKEYWNWRYAKAMSISGHNRVKAKSWNQTCSIPSVAKKKSTLISSNNCVWWSVKVHEKSVMRNPSAGALVVKWLPVVQLRNSLLFICIIFIFSECQILCWSSSMFNFLWGLDVNLANSVTQCKIW